MTPQIIKLAVPRAYNLPPNQAAMIEQHVAKAMNPTPEPKPQARQDALTEQRKQQVLDYMRPGREYLAADLAAALGYEKTQAISALLTAMGNKGWLTKRRRPTRIKHETRWYTYWMLV